MYSFYDNIFLHYSYNIHIVVCILYYGRLWKEKDIITNYLLITIIFICKKKEKLGSHNTEELLLVLRT